MFVNESTEFTIQRIMQIEEMDYEEAKEYLSSLLEEDNFDFHDLDDRCGMGDCFCDAL